MAIRYPSSPGGHLPIAYTFALASLPDRRGCPAPPGALEQPSLLINVTRLLPAVPSLSRLFLLSPKETTPTVGMEREVYALHRGVMTLYTSYTL